MFENFYIKPLMHHLFIYIHTCPDWFIAWVYVLYLSQVFLSHWTAYSSINLTNVCANKKKKSRVISLTATICTVCFYCLHDFLPLSTL